EQCGERTVDTAGDRRPGQPGDREGQESCGPDEPPPQSRRARSRESGHGGQLLTSAVAGDRGNGTFVESLDSSSSAASAKRGGRSRTITPRAATHRPQ